MLFILASLNMGGVETFCLRLAKQRAKEGRELKVVVLSQRKKSNPVLVEMVEQHSSVFFYEDISFPVISGLLTYHMAQVLPLNKEKVITLLEGVDHIHGCTSHCTFFGLRLLTTVADSNQIRVSTGVYHSLEYIWGADAKLPYYEQRNRDLFFDILNKDSLIFFNESCRNLYQKRMNMSFEESSLFPLGVVDNSRVPLKKNYCNSSQVKIVSVGRLVEFKKYNLWMLEVISELIKAGNNITYDIYGEGPLEEELKKRINLLNLNNYVRLRGNIDYASFGETILRFDLFVGSGTAIVEAASYGVPSIIGIENCCEPISYGFLTDVPGFSYNEDGLYEKVKVIELISRFISSSIDEKDKLSEQHIEKSSLFTLDACSRNFDEVTGTLKFSEPLVNSISLLNRVKYSVSFFWTTLKLRLQGSSLNELVRN